MLKPEMQIMDNLNQLKHSDIDFENIFDLSPDKICILDIDHNIIRANQALAERLGVSPDSIIGTKCFQCVHQTDEPPSFCVLTQMLKEGKKVTIDMPIECLGGWFSVTASPLRNDKGTIIGAIHISRDIAEQKKSLELLKESELHYHQLFEQANEGLILMSKEGQIVEVNRAFAEMHGYSVDEIKKINIRDLDVLREGTITERAPKNQQLKDGEIVRFESEHYHKDGHIITFSVTGSIIIIGDQQFYLGFHQDITERKQELIELLESKQLIENIINTLPARVFWKDTNHIYQGCNLAYAKDAGYSDPKEIIGKDDYQLFGGDLAELYRTDDREVIEGRCKKVNIEEPLPNTKGETRTVLTNKAPILDKDGEATGVLGVYWDITERKKATDALQENEEYFQSLFVNAPMAYQSLDEDGCFIDVNQQWLRTLGYNREDVIGKWFGEFLAPEFVDSFKERFPLFKARGEVQSEFEMLHKDGERKVIAFGGRIGYKPDGTFNKTHCVLSDITEHKQYEEALIKKTRQLEQLNDAFVDRELRMIEMKKEINELLIKAGSEKRY
ncbi:PAS domain-containing protein [Bacteroidota bacterium]